LQLYIIVIDQTNLGSV